MKEKGDAVWDLFWQAPPGVPQLEIHFSSVSSDSHGRPNVSFLQDYSLYLLFFGNVFVFDLPSHASTLRTTPVCGYPLH
jgi:hypothetical protein